ncbi:MAG: outer membrane protein assembly factor BamA [Rickettsia sp.]|nr:outer membrane protein assembly factor BamA [Rickettsia sp.]
MSKIITLLILLLLSCTEVRAILDNVQDSKNIDSKKENLIKNIVITGNSKISDSSILQHLNIGKSEYFSLNLEKRILVKLHDSKFFQEVNLKFSNNTIFLNVKENNIVYKVQIEGNKEIDQKKIFPYLKLKNDEYLDHSKITQDLKTIVEIYKSQGFVDTQVSYKILQDKKNSQAAKVIYTINDGIKPKLSGVIFTGNHSFSSEDLENIVINNSPKYLLGSIFSKDNLNKDILYFDQIKLINFYKSFSYANVDVKTTLLYKDKKFFVLHSINEGCKYYFGSIKVKFENNIPDISEDDVLKYSQALYGKDFSQLDIEKSEMQMLEFFNMRGFPNVDIVVENILDEFNHMVDIVFKIKSTFRKYIENIDILNNYQSEDFVIRNNSLLHEGDLYNLNLYNKSLKLLVQSEHNMLLLPSRKIFALPNINKFYSDLIITEQRKQSSQDRKGLSTSVDFNSQNGVGINARLVDSSFLGKSLFLDINGYWGNSLNKYDLSLIKDNFLLTNSKLGFLFDSKRTKNSKESSSLGQELSQAKKDFHHYNERLFKNKIFLQTYKDKISFVWGTYWNILDISILNQKYFFQKDEGKFTDIGLDFDMSYENTKQVFVYNPFIKEGFRTLCNFKASIFSPNIKYLGSAFELFWGKKLFTNIFLKTTAHAGLALPLCDNEIRVFQRFNLGDMSLRGFKEDGVGPYIKDSFDSSSSKIHVGGNYTYNASLEILFDLNFISQKFVITPLGFIDMGSVFGISNADKYPEIIDNFSNRISCGLGARMILPGLGLLEFGYGIPIKYDENNDNTHSFHFNIGLSL